MTDSASSISTELLAHLRILFGMALEEIISPKRTRDGINGYTTFAVPAYIIAVATAEAFVNEMFISPTGRSFFRGSESEQYWTDIERVELSDKLLLLPEKYFGRSLVRGTQPHQDMQTLIKVRNDLVHYKMQFEPPKYIKYLQQRHITLTLPNSTWVDEISTTEGIRWAHNTICETVRALGSLATSHDHAILVSMSNHEYFNPISESKVYDWFAQKGIDLHL